MEDIFPSFCCFLTLISVSSHSLSGRKALLNKLFNTNHLIMKNASELKASARQSLCGVWNEAAVLTLVYGVISMLSAIPYIGYILSILVLLPIAWGYNIAFLTNAREGGEFRLGSLTDGFNDYGRILGTVLLQGIYTFLWALLLIVPGIIKSYSYAMTPYILKDNPELRYNSAIERSMAMMDGYKWKYFCLQLSFIGWAIVCIFTLGIGYLWLYPYVLSAQAKFYLEVKANYEDGESQMA